MTATSMMIIMIAIPSTVTFIVTAAPPARKASISLITWHRAPSPGPRRESGPAGAQKGGDASPVRMRENDCGA
jgi:hypothetical protein